MEQKYSLFEKDKSFFYFSAYYYFVKLQKEASKSISAKKQKIEEQYKDIEGKLKLSYLRQISELR